MVFAGIIAGLGAATAQSLSYLFSRHFIQKGAGTIPALFVTSHILMGLFSLAVLPLLASQASVPFREYAIPLFGAAISYMTAQVSLLLTLDKTEPSKIAPLLGLKIVVLALLVMVVQHETLNALQWLAVVICVAAAFLLNETGGRLPAKAAIGLAVTIIGYSLSDFNIVILVKRLSACGNLAPCIGVCYSYILCGALSVPLLFIFRPFRLATWKGALPYALSWYVSMIFLFTCFSLIGVVFGNIIQSTRGLISILLGVAIAKIGLTHLETHVSKAVFWKRVLGALLMMTAITLYVLNSAKK